MLGLSYNPELEVGDCSREMINPVYERASIVAKTQKSQVLVSLRDKDGRRKPYSLPYLGGVMRERSHTV